VASSKVYFLALGQREAGKPGGKRGRVAGRRLRSTAGAALCVVRRADRSSFSAFFRIALQVASMAPRIRR